jgi:hypothetical protein
MEELKRLAMLKEADEKKTQVRPYKTMHPKQVRDNDLRR